jgi:hypothetical protein
MFFLYETWTEFCTRPGQRVGILTGRPERSKGVRRPCFQIFKIPNPTFPIQFPLSSFYPTSQQSGYSSDKVFITSEIFWHKVFIHALALSPPLTNVCHSVRINVERRSICPGEYSIVSQNCCIKSKLT